MSEQIQKLENTVIILKSRLFDAGESLVQAQSQAKEYGGILSKIAELVGLSGEQIQLSDIVEAVEGLLPVQNELELKETAAE